MKQYPSMSSEIVDIDVYAFNKLDGSNIRAEFSRKRGFYKFGSRRCLIDEKHEQLGQSISLIQETMAPQLCALFKEERVESAICFFEFYGPNSFAGQHQADDPKRVDLIDAVLNKKGFLAPNDYLKMFKGIPQASLLYVGKPNKTFQESVRNSTLEGMSLEGVVCKAVHKKQILMFKIKSLAWLNKLKSFCKDDENLFNQLK